MNDDRASPSAPESDTRVLDIDPEETAEWLESLDAVVGVHGAARGEQLVRSLVDRAGLRDEPRATTDYVNTISAADEPAYPGDEDLERRHRAWMRWNAAVLVHRAQRPGIGVGGHISTYAGAATLYEVGFNHFFRGRDAVSRTRATSTRRFFKIDSRSVVVRALQLLAARGEVDAAAAAQAAERCRLLDVNAGTSGDAGGDA